MALDVKAEVKRGFADAAKQLEVLRAKWPKAFPNKPAAIRPLALGSVQIIANEMGWSTPYTRAVLNVWKMRDAYCQAVLAYDFRIALDGSPTESPIAENARVDARKTIEQRKAKRKRDAEKAALRAKLSLAAGNQDENAAETSIDPPKPAEAQKPTAEANSRTVSA
jgi:sRNA-binding protein